MTFSNELENSVMPEKGHDVVLSLKKKKEKMYVYH